MLAESACMRTYGFRGLPLFLATLLGCGAPGLKTSDGGAPGSSVGGGTDDDGGGVGVALPDAPQVRVSGKVVDFESGQPIAGTATVTTAGLLPAPLVSVKAGEFVLEEVAAN